MCGWARVQYLLIRQRHSLAKALKCGFLSWRWLFRPLITESSLVTSSWQLASQEAALLGVVHIPGWGECVGMVIQSKKSLVHVRKLIADIITDLLELYTYRVSGPRLNFWGILS